MMRLTGFASGMDIEKMVGDLMKAERVPMDKMVKERETIAWKMEDFRSINLKFREFHTNIFDTVMRKGQMGARTGSSTNNSRVSVEATSAATGTTYEISNVKQLATAASQTSIDAINASGDFSPSKRLDSVTSDDIWKKGKVNQTTLQGDGSKTLTIKKDGATMINDPDNMVIKVNGELYKASEGDVQVTASGDELTLSFQDALKTTDDVSVQYFTEDPDGESKYMSGDITTYDKDGNALTDRIVVSGGQSLKSAMQSLSQSDVGISGFYDEHTGKVAFTRSETGEFNTNGNEMSFSGTLFTEFINMSGAAERGGQNAKFTVNGLETERHSNTFNLDGMNVTLNETFAENDGKAVTVGSSIDTDSVYETIKGFVDEYNEMLDMVNGKLTEEYFPDYDPLTDEQKNELSDREVKLWEEKAQSGLIRNDSMLSGFMDTFRLDLYGAVEHDHDTDYKQLTTIGITTSSDYMERGKLEIDENKLRNAIEEDPEAVYQLFAADGPTKQEQGIARRLRASLDTAIEGVAERAGGAKGKIQNHQFTLGRNLEDVEDRISDFERRLTTVENRYWRQFTAMEKAMARANQQAGFLQQQFGGGGGA